MSIKYKIKFLDYWHVGTGLSGGVYADNLVLKDGHDLPFIGGKTIKGLVKDSFFAKEVKELFGQEEDKDSKLYFSNLSLDEDTSKAIITAKLQEKLYDTITSTKINENGVAETNSLRDIQVVVPMTLYGEIEFIEEVSAKEEESLKKALRCVKRVGLNRNRGLGRCVVSIEEDSSGR